MNFLFIFAHPDDETVSCAETLYQLGQHGHQAYVVSVTDGSAGNVSQPARGLLKRAGTVVKLRKQEFESACKLLSVYDYRILNYVDGELSNQLVWGLLKDELVSLIDQLHPDVVVTFDHSGWYYHLDHVGVSIATTLAFHQAQWRTPLLLMSQMPFATSRWQYVFTNQVPVDFAVLVSDPARKVEAMKLHLSQDLSPLISLVESLPNHKEWFQVGFANEKATDVLSPLPFFAPVESASVERLVLE